MPDKIGLSGNVDLQPFFFNTIIVLSNSKINFILDKLAKLFEQGLINYKDLSNEILNILKSKRDEIVFKMKLTSKDEFDILAKRVENLEKELEKKKVLKKKIKRVKKS